MVSMPALNPVTTPVDVFRLACAFDIAKEPPGTGSEIVKVDPTHSVVSPVIVPGSGRDVIVIGNESLVVPHEFNTE
jgi:hypothetical protein